MTAFVIRDDALTGLVLASGLPARTMPVTTWARLGLKRPEAAVVSMQRPASPYWTGEEVPCITPIQVDLLGTAVEIKATMG
jgi:hypothetical protein